MVRQGSVILVVLMMLAVLTGIGFSVLRSTSFLLDSTLSREQYTKQYYATEALMRYGISLGERYFNVFKEGQQEIDIGAWPSANASFQGKLLFTPEKDGLAIKALLNEHRQVCCSIICLLTQDSSGMVIQNWKIGAE